MNTENKISLPSSISKNSSLLLLFAVVTAAILASTYAGTKNVIAIAERKAAEESSKRQAEEEASVREAAIANLEAELDSTDDVEERTRIRRELRDG